MTARRVCVACVAAYAAPGQAKCVDCAPVRAKMAAPATSAPAAQPRLTFDPINPEALQ